MKQKKPLFKFHWTFGTFRVGIWPNYFPGVQFSKDPEALNQYFRSMVPSMGPIDFNVNTDAASALVTKIALQYSLPTHMPEVGIKGNTHFPFSDLNDVQIADLMSKWLKEKQLDK